MAAARPFGVTVVAVIAWITGLWGVVWGTFTLIGGNTSVGVTSILIGLLTFFVSLGLFRGSNLARVLTAILFAVNVASAITLFVTQAEGFWGAVGAGILPLIGFIILFTKRANSFFR